MEHREESKGLEDELPAEVIQGDDAEDYREQSRWQGIGMRSGALIMEDQDQWCGSRVGEQEVGQAVFSHRVRDSERRCRQ